MRSGGRIGGNELMKVASLSLGVLMTCGTISLLSPFVASNTMIQPLAGDLGVTFRDLAPDTHTFPGDDNITMIGLEMTASSGDVQVRFVTFALGGTVIPSGIDSVALWGDSYSDVEGRWHTCEFARTAVTASTFTIPQTGDLEECTGTPGRSFLITTSSTRFLFVRLSVNDAASANTTIQLSVSGITTDGNVVGGTGTTAPIWILNVLFRDDMETGQNGWTVSGGDGAGTYPNGLWHLSSGEEDCVNNDHNENFYNSPVTSWWYGHKHEDPWNPGTFVCTFATWIPANPMNFTSNWGNLTSPWINTTGMRELYIAFWHMLWGEPDLITKIDDGFLWLYDGTWHKISPNYDYIEIWQRESYNLSAYAGRSIKLEFRFDTIDRLNNFFLGWFVDDVTLYGTSSRAMIPPRPPTISKAVLFGPDHEDVRISWELSADDSAPFFGVDRYDVYRGDIYDSNGIGYALYDSVPKGTSEYSDIHAGQGDPSNHFYMICAVGSNGLGECTRGQAGKFTRELSHGMNLISIPLIQWDDSLATVLQTVAHDNVWGYDSPGKKWSWQMESKPYNGALLQVDHTMGFWVDITQDSSLTVAGLVPTATDIGLHEGWNLVGFPLLSRSFTVGDLRRIIPIDEIEGYDQLMSPYFLREMSDADVLQTGFAYWISVTSCSTWIVDNS